jgi:hypothetical protein
MLVICLALLGVGLGVMLAVMGRAPAGAEVLADGATRLPPPPAVDSAELDKLLPPDAIPAINDPQFETAQAAAALLKPDERVIGLVINGQARAYPINIMSSHEIVNDVVGGQPVAVTWCPLCYSALVFSRRVEGQAEPLTFGVSGSLLYNTLVMFDRETESLWSQLYGGALDGPLAGQSLAVYPSLHTEWAAWQAQHPDTLVLSKRLTCRQFGCGTYAANPRASYLVDPYAGYYNQPDEGVIDSQIPRDPEDDFFRAEPRAPTEKIVLWKERVLGLRLAGRARAYPYQVLADEPLVNDAIGGEPVLVWFDPETQAGAAYSRRLGERTLTFRADPGAPGGLLDDQTGSRWVPATGQAVEGPLSGQALTPLVVTPAFEFGWFDYFPESDVYGGE